MAGDETYCEDNKPGEEVAICFFFLTHHKACGMEPGSHVVEVQSPKLWTDCQGISSVQFYLFIGPSAWHMGSSSSNRDWTGTPCIGSMES